MKRTVPNTKYEIACMGWVNSKLQSQHIAQADLTHKADLRNNYIKQIHILLTLFPAKTAMPPCLESPSSVEA